MVNFEGAIFFSKQTSSRSEEQKIEDTRNNTGNIVLFAALIFLGFF